MSYQIKALDFFGKQVEKLDKDARQLIYDKIQLIKENPFRYKKIHSYQFSKVFRVRLTIRAKELRLVYVVLEPNIVLVCLLDRNKDYKELEKYLAKLKKSGF